MSLWLPETSSSWNHELLESDWRWPVRERAGVRGQCGSQKGSRLEAEVMSRFGQGLGCRGRTSKRRRAEGSWVLGQERGRELRPAWGLIF